MLIGLAAAFLVPGDIIVSMVTFGGTGVVIMISGVVALQAYLRNSPPPGEGQ